MEYLRRLTIVLVLLFFTSIGLVQAADQYQIDWKAVKETKTKTLAIEAPLNGVENFFLTVCHKQQKSSLFQNNFSAALPIQSLAISPIVDHQPAKAEILFRDYLRSLYLDNDFNPPLVLVNHVSPTPLIVAVAETNVQEKKQSSLKKALSKATGSIIKSLPKKLKKRNRKAAKNRHLNNSQAQKQFEQHIQSIYYDIQLNHTDLDYTVFKYALTGLYNLKEQGKIPKPEILTIIDYRKHCNKDRLFVIDLRQKQLIYNTLVSHGKQSGLTYARKFSNRFESHQTSLGFYRTAEPYFGKHGYSLRLDGLDYGFNHNARKRAIVMHGAEYVGHNFLKFHGRIGRSWGCPAVDQDLARPMIDLLKWGSCMFLYNDDINYLNNSSHMNFDQAARYYMRSYY